MIINWYSLGGPQETRFRLRRYSMVGRTLSAAESWFQTHGRNGVDLCGALKGPAERVLKELFKKENTHG